MGLKSSSRFTLTLLIIAALCLEVLLMKYSIYYLERRKTWTEARLHCQRNHIDLATWETLNRSSLREQLENCDTNQVWIGLHRDPEDDSVWKWINVITGKGLSGANLTKSSKWDKEQSGHCAVIKNDQMWHSVLCSTESKVFCSVNDHNHLFGNEMNWHNASHYCSKKKNGNLVTITTTNKHKIKGEGWIGLYRQAENNWNWIGNNMSSMYRNWAPGEPLTKDCGSVDRDSKWHSNECSKNMSFVCYDDCLVVVNVNKTWEEALTHCKGIKVKSGLKCRLSYTGQSLYDSSYVRERIYKATTDEVWIGLRFLAGQWLWMTEHTLNVQGTLPQCPSQRAHCGALSKHDTNDTNNWIIRDCTERRNFVCLKQGLWNGVS